jgi:phosphate:Na+ symporter
MISKILVASEVAGGVVLFLLGMQMLGAALRASAGERLRSLLTGATRSRVRGLALGVSAGTLVHSSAATVMTVGFVHAGLLSLGGALPVLFGANVGTTFSMQLVSLRLTDYALAMVAAGGVWRMVVKTEQWKRAGEALLGFGLLFLGMKISGGAIEPHREAFAGWLGAMDGASLRGLLVGTAVATVVTAMVQSSGAVIGMAFVLAGSGVLAGVSQTYPIVLGAHIGTTVTALIAAVGTSAEARATATANCAFNVLNVAVGIVAAGWILPALEWVGGDVVRQTANAHTLVMLLGVVVALPLTRPAIALLTRFHRSNEPERPGSFLDREKLRTPEDAIVAVLRELGRCADLCCESFALVNRAFRGERDVDLRRVAKNENSIDEIKASTRAYLHELARTYLSRRQALMVQGLDRCVLGVERIGDHVDSLAYLVRKDGGHVLDRLDAATASALARVADLAEKTVRAVARSFAADNGTLEAASWEVLDARNTFMRESAPVRANIEERLSRHEVPARVVLAFGEYAVALERIVRHCAILAQEQRRPSFKIKSTKLGRLAGPHASLAPPADAD